MSKAPNQLDYAALKRVFGTANPQLVSKNKLIRANTSHMQFIDYMMVELYIASPEHHLFNDFTEEQHAKMEEEIENRAKAVEAARKKATQHSPDCTEERCADDCPLAAAAEEELPEMQDASNAGAVIPEREGTPEQIAAEDHEADKALAAELAEDDMLNLCDTCTATFPDCAANADDVEYGNGPGKDNIIKCKEYKKKGAKRG